MPPRIHVPVGGDLDGKQALGWAIASDDSSVWQHLPAIVAPALVEQLDTCSLQAALAACRGWRSALGASVDAVCITLRDTSVHRYCSNLATAVPALMHSLQRCCPQLHHLRIHLDVRGAAPAAFERAASEAGAMPRTHEAMRLVVAALLQQLPRLTHLRSLALVAVQQQSGVVMPLGALTALTQLTLLEVSLEHDAAELQPICLALTRLQTLHLGGSPPAQAAAAAGARLAPWAPWRPRTQYSLRCLGSLTCLASSLRALRLSAQAAAGAALPLIVRLTQLTRLELEAAASDPQMDTRGMQPAHLALLGQLRELRALALPTVRYDAKLSRLPPGGGAWGAALAAGLAPLVRLARLRLVMGDAPGDADLAVLAPLVAAPGQQLHVVELQLHGTLGGGWGAGWAGLQQPVRGADGDGGGDAGGAALTRRGVAFLGAVPEVALLLPGDVDTLAPLAPLLALPNLRRVEVARCSVLARGVVQPLVGCAALTMLSFQEVLFTSLGESYTLLCSRAFPDCFASLANLTSLSLTLVAGEHAAHMLTDESALALAYGAPSLQRLEWVVRGLCRRAAAPPPPAVRAAKLTDSGVAALLGMRALHSLVLHAPVRLLQAVSPAMAALGARGGRCLAAVDLALRPNPWRDDAGGGASLGAAARSPPGGALLRRAKHRFSEHHALLELLPPSVVTLALCLPALGDAAVAQIARRCPRLEALTLHACGRRLGRAGLECLAGAPALTSLTLCVPRRAQLALAHAVAALPALRCCRRVEVRALAAAAAPLGGEATEGDDSGCSSDDGSDDDGCV